MTSLGTGFDLLLVRGALGALALAALWCVVVVATCAAEALSDGRIRLASRTGCPAAVRAWIVGAFVAAVAGVAPAHASDTGPGGAPSAPLAAAVDGLPMPDRVVGSGGATPTTYVVHPGDSLWSIARHALPPDVTDAVVAAAVADLYVANRATVGADPDLVRPGQRLRTATLSRLRDHITHQEER